MRPARGCTRRAGTGRTSRESPITSASAPARLRFSCCPGAIRDLTFLVGRPESVPPVAWCSGAPDRLRRHVPERGVPSARAASPLALTTPGGQSRARWRHSAALWSSPRRR